MLRIFLLIAFIIGKTCAKGQFAVLSHPSYIEFQENEPLNTDDIDSVVYASVGMQVSPKADWGGLYVNNVFARPSIVSVILIEGVNNIDFSYIKAYELIGDSAYDSYSRLLSEVATTKNQLCNIDLRTFNDGIVDFKKCFGDSALPTDSGVKPDNKPDEMLKSISLINKASENFTTSNTSINFYNFRLNLEYANNLTVEDERKTKIKDALSDVISEVKTKAEDISNLNALVVAIVMQDSDKRVKREAEGGGKKAQAFQGSNGSALRDYNDYNFAKYYSEDYPVIFNIILWFMVAFFFSLLAVSYTIAVMDPGKDSIIYRMTSTRMKKDN